MSDIYNANGTGDGGGGRGGTVIRAEEPGQMPRAGPWRRRRLKLAGVQLPTTATPCSRFGTARSLLGLSELGIPQFQKADKKFILLPIMHQRFVHSAQ